MPPPNDLKQAAVEQVAAWYQSRDKLGLDTTAGAFPITLDTGDHTDSLPNRSTVGDDVRRLQNNEPRSGFQKIAPGWSAGFGGNAPTRGYRPQKNDSPLPFGTGEG